MFQIHFGKYSSHQKYSIIAVFRKKKTVTSGGHMRRKCPQARAAFFIPSSASLSSHSSLQANKPPHRCPAADSAEDRDTRPANHYSNRANGALHSGASGRRAVGAFAAQLYHATMRERENGTSIISSPSVSQPPGPRSG
ncbi:hypothetical protein E2C01_029755 [Portunus trituberculatus]|uniref:Uncharacterized protein n=1 Tax=Portunus trituberculatus TaxID=210409 RepID=A0A5B7ENQ9_PORTR|nr:hypothetical protein [Portunus trituberculatus]